MLGATVVLGTGPAPSIPRIFTGIGPRAISSNLSWRAPIRIGMRRLNFVPRASTLAILAACSPTPDGTTSDAAVFGDAATADAADATLDARSTDAATADARDSATVDGPIDAASDAAIDGRVDAIPDASVPIPCIERVSLTSTGGQLNSGSFIPRLSADGRWVHFVTAADNVVPGEIGSAMDVFLLDRVNGSTLKVSYSAGGGGADGNSFAGDLADDASLVAFDSDATNLATGDTNAQTDTFLRSRITAITERVSISSDGTQGNGESRWPDVSGNNRFVVFESNASNLVAGDTNGTWDVFVRDLATRTTSRVNVAPDGSQANFESHVYGGSVISDDGRFVAFSSLATNLVPGGTPGNAIYVRDRLAATTELIADGGPATISADGRHVVFSSSFPNIIPGETNSLNHIFVHDRLTQVTQRVSVSSDGSRGNRSSSSFDASGDARFIVFNSNATNLVAGDTNGTMDVFVHDRLSHVTSRVSVACNGDQAASYLGPPTISRDGRYIAFSDNSPAFVPGDTNGVTDIFVVPNPLAP